MPESRKITKPEYRPDLDDLTVWFEDTGTEPFSEREFREGSLTRLLFEGLRHTLSMNCGVIADVEGEKSYRLN